MLLSKATYKYEKVNYKLKYYIYTFKKIKKLNKMRNAYNNISKLNIEMKTKS